MASVSCYACPSSFFLSSFLVAFILHPFKKAGRRTHSRPLISWAHVFDYLVLSWWHCLGRLLDLYGAEPCWRKWVNVKTKLRLSSFCPHFLFLLLCESGRVTCQLSVHILTVWGKCHRTALFLYSVFQKWYWCVIESSSIFLLFLFRILVSSQLSTLYVGLWNKQKDKFTGENLSAST